MNNLQFSLYIGGLILFGIIIFLATRRKWLLRKWWMFRHPESVYRAIFYYPNSMYEMYFVHTYHENFSYKKGTYNINKKAIIKRNWTGWLVGKETVKTNENNLYNYNEYKIMMENKFINNPKKAEIIGELHYIYGNPNPILYTEMEDQAILTNESPKLKTAKDMHTVQKTAVLDNLISAQFKKISLTIIIIICVLILLCTALLVGARMELIDIPLHAICVNLPPK